MNSSLSKRIRVLELLVRVPFYSVAGFTNGKVVYVSDAEGVMSLWSLDPVSGESQRLTREPIHSVAKPHPRSRYVVFTRDVTRGKELQKPFIVNVDGGDEVLFADVPPMRFFGMVWDGERERLIFSAATASGMGLFVAERGAYEKLMDVDTIMYPTDVEGDLIVGAGMLRKNPMSMELFLYNMGTGELRIYTPKEGSVNKEPVIKNGKVLFESNFEGTNALYIYDVVSGELTRPKFSHKDYHEYGASEHLAYGWVNDGRIWVVAKKNGRTKPFIDGKVVASPEGTVGYLAINEDATKAYYSASSLTTPSKIYEVDLERNKYRVLLDNPLPKELEGKIGKSYFVKCRSSDGLEVPMYVVESATASKPGPTVVYVHGGPWSEVYDIWSTLINSLSVMGYHVLAPNFRGSTGYGEKFRLMDIGDPGGGEMGY